MAHHLDLFAHSFDLRKVKEIKGGLTLHGRVGWFWSASQIVHYRFRIVVGSEHLSEVLGLLPSFPSPHTFSALTLKHCTTPLNTLAGWWELKSRYLSVCESQINVVLGGKQKKKTEIVCALKEQKGLCFLCVWQSNILQPCAYVFFIYPFFCTMST